jgi:4-hydroxy-tetrahydrodipicolinate reductase
MVKLIITGAAGKVGVAIIKCALEDTDFEIVGLVETKTHPDIGKLSATMAGTTDKLLLIEDSLEKVIEKGDAVIDFTEAKASLEHFRIAKQHGKAHVIGTTGFSDDALAEIHSAKDMKAVISPNMSIGMNVLFDVANKVAGVLKEGYDVEIVEMHHRWKKDAPSGSALRIKDAIETAKPDRKWTEVFGREGITGERKTHEIGIMSLRGGDVIGEHTVFFAGMGERLELTHRAFSRDNFARGSLMAAKWLIQQPYGIYSMKDVLGL